MADPNLKPPAPRGAAAGLLLQTLGGITLFLAPAAAFALLAWRSFAETQPDATFVQGLVLLFIVGLTGGALMAGAGTALRVWSLGPSRAAHEPPAAEPLTHGGAEHSLNGRASATVDELRWFAMLSSEEQTAARERLHTNQVRRAAEAVIEALNLRQIARARTLLEDARAAFGQTPTFERLEAKVEEADARNEPLDFAATRRGIDDAIRRGDWAGAEDAAHALYLDHPGSQRCRKLWEETRRARLYAHIQRAANDRHWLEALAAAEEFLERFPDSFEAETLRTQMDTLRGNAEIQRRRQYETRFKDLIAARHYAEALRVAKAVVEQFPQSPQAEALRDQIPALEQRLSAPTPVMA